MRNNGAGRVSVGHSRVRTAREEVAWAEDAGRPVGSRSTTEDGHRAGRSRGEEVAAKKEGRER